ncbi:MAG: AMP-binding protein [Sphingobium sp.]
MFAQAAVKPIGASIADRQLSADQVLVEGAGRTIRAGDLEELIGRGAAYVGKRIGLCLTDPFDCVSAILALDGHADTLLLLSPDLPARVAEQVMAKAGGDHILSDRDDLPGAEPWGDQRLDEVTERALARNTQWLLTTSGTTGMPKLVQHDHASIVRSVRTIAKAADARWAMLYDPSRFAGTQVIAQALLGGGTLLIPDHRLSTGETVDWLGERGCTHVSATPSLWRRILMAPSVKKLALRQVTLGGEIADAAILSALRGRFPEARITHIYASTEAGTGFAVRDGMAGFPADWLDQDVDGVRLAIRDGILWLRPAADTMTSAEHIERDAQGFIRTADRVTVDGERVMFLGREDMALNVGGTKVQVEAVEDVVHAHPAVAQCRISARPSAMMGNLLTLSVVPKEQAVDAAALKRDIASWCRDQLPAPARPATIRIVPEIAITAAGKQQRAVHG